MPPVIVWPRSTSPPPSGVPLSMRSPGRSPKNVHRLSITSRTDQIILAISTALAVCTVDLQPHRALRRVTHRRLALTAAGQALLGEVVPAMLRAQDRMLAPLPKRERFQFMRMLRVLVTANNEHSRAPSDGGP